MAKVKETEVTAPKVVFLAVPQPLAQGIVDYLVTRPFSEVANLVLGLQQVQPVQEEDEDD